MGLIIGIGLIGFALLGGALFVLLVVPLLLATPWQANLSPQS